MKARLGKMVLILIASCLTVLRKSAFAPAKWQNDTQKKVFMFVVKSGFLVAFPLGIVSRWARTPSRILKATDRRRDILIWPSPHCQTSMFSGERGTQYRKLRPRHDHEHYSFVGAVCRHIFSLGALIGTVMPPNFASYRAAHLYSISRECLPRTRSKMNFACPSISGNLPMTRKKARHQFTRGERVPRRARRRICSG